MGVTLDEDQIHKLYELKKKGRTIPQIAEEVGISESSVKRYIKARDEGGSKSRKKNRPDDSRARTHKEEGGSKSGSKNELKNELVEAYAEEAEIDRKMLARASLSDFDFIMDKCMQGLLIAQGIDNGRDRATAEAAYLKIMRDIAIARGKYGGLDNVPVETAPVSPLDDLSRTLAQFTEEDE